MSDSLNSLSRDEFISFLIAELQSQKESQGNTPDFFTGQAFTPTQSFKKLCYDSPLIQNYDLRGFVDDLKLRRENPSQLTDSLFFHYFNFNEPFLKNLFYLTFQEEESVIIPGDTTTPNQYLEKSRKEIIGFLLIEIFLEYPLHVLTLSQEELSNLLHPTTSRIFSLNLDYKGQRILLPDENNFVRDIEDEDMIYSWEEIVQLWKQYLLKGSSSLLVTGLNHPTVKQKLSLHSILTFLRTLKQMISPNRSAAKVAKQPNNLQEYLFTVQVSSLDPSNTPQLAIYAAIKEILTHYIFVINDLLCQFPDLFPTYFPLLAEILIDKHLDIDMITSPLLSEVMIEANIFGNHHLILILKNISTFINNEEQYLQLHSNQLKVSSSKVEVPSLENNPANANSPPRPIVNAQSLKNVKETVRKFFISNNHLSNLVTFIETVYQTKINKSMEQKTTITNQDIEVFSYYLEIGELFFGGARIVTSITKTVYQQVVTSRLLSHLLSSYYQILTLYLEIEKKITRSVEGFDQSQIEIMAILNDQGSVLSDYSLRLTKLLTTGILRDEGILQFIVSSPDTSFLWNELLFLLKQPELIEKRHLQHPQWIVWSVHLGTAFAYVSYLRSSSAASTMNSFWYDFIIITNQTILHDLRTLQLPEIVEQFTTVLEEVEEEEIEGVDKAAKEDEVDERKGDASMIASDRRRNNDRKEEYNRIKQYFLKYLEGIQILCLIMNQEEFSLIRSLKARQDPSIESFFQMMKKFTIEVTNHLRNLRNQLQIKRVETWILEAIDRVIKLTKTMQSSFEGNTSNKTD